MFIAFRSNKLHDYVSREDRYINLNLAMPVPDYIYLMCVCGQAMECNVIVSEYFYVFCNGAYKGCTRIAQYNYCDSICLPINPILSNSPDSARIKTIYIYIHCHKILPSIQLLFLAVCIISEQLCVTRPRYNAYQVCVNIVTNY